MLLFRTTRPTVPFRARLTAVCWLLVALLIPSTAAPGEPRPSSHRYIPARGLVAYFEFDGLDAHADAWKATAAHVLLTKTRAGAMMTEAAGKWVDWLADENLGLLTRAETVAVGDHLLRKGFVLAIHNRGVTGFDVTLVLNGFGGKDVRYRFLTSMLFGPDEKGGDLLWGPVRLRGRDVFVLRYDEQPPAPARLKDDERGLIPDPANDKKANLAHLSINAWVEGDDVIIIWHDDSTAGPCEPEAPKTLTEMHKDDITPVFDAIEGKVPNVTTHPGYLSALAGDKDIKGSEPIGLFFAGPSDNKGLFTAVMEWDRAAAQKGESQRRLQLPGGTELMSGFPVWKELEARGLDDIKRIAVRWGFQGKAVLTDVRIEAPVPRKVLSIWFDQPALNKTHLPPVPPGINTFAVASFKPAKTYQTLSDLLNSMGPRGTDEVRRIEKVVRDEIQLCLREDLLKHVGPTWWAFRVPSREGDGHEPDKAGPASNVLLASVENAEAFTKVLDALAPRVNQYLRGLNAENAANGQGKKGKPSREIGLERLPAPARGYRLTSAGCRALGLDAGVEPVILVDRSLVAVATDLDWAREALASSSRQESRRKPSDELAKILDSLPAGLTFLAVADPHESSLAHWIVSLPSMLKFVWSTNSKNDPDNASDMCLLDLIGIPRPGGLGVKIKPSPIPAPDALRPYLFPSVLATTVDDRGWRLISRQAFPLELMELMAVGFH
ncbi:MAG: hypothetical protein ACHRXM_11280 [Isosphaerales bacterium]